MGAEDPEAAQAQAQEAIDRVVGSAYMENP